MKPLARKAEYERWLKALPILWAADFMQVPDEGGWWVFIDLQTLQKHDLSAADLTKLEEIRRKGLFQVS